MIRSDFDQKSAARSDSPTVSESRAIFFSLAVALDMVVKSKMVRLPNVSGMMLKEGKLMVKHFRDSRKSDM